MSKSPVQKIEPHLWYTKEAEEAARFYASIFPESRVDRVTALPADSPAGPAGSVTVVEFTLFGQSFMAISAGSHDSFNDAVSFLVNCSSQAEIDRYWNALLEHGGKPQACGWIIDKYGVRWQIHPTALGEMLADLQPVIVRPLGGGKFELVAGERRWRAAQRAGLHRVPAVIREVPDEKLLELALIENLQREDLNPIEEAEAYQLLLDDLGLTQQEVASRVGKQRTRVTNALRLLGLPRKVQEDLRAGRLGAGHGKAIAGLASASDQTSLAERTVREGLSVRQVEAIVARMSGPKSSKGARVSERDPNVVAAEQNLQRALGTKVRIVGGPKRGRVELAYYSAEELDRLYQTLARAGSKGQGIR